MDFAARTHKPSAAERQLTLGAQITTTGAIDTDLASTRSLIAINSGGQSIPLGSTASPIPHAATTANALRFDNLPDGFVLADAELVSETPTSIRPCSRWTGPLRRRRRPSTWRALSPSPSRIEATYAAAGVMTLP